MLATALLLTGAAAGPVEPAELELQVANLRSSKGIVRVCVTAEAAHFPDCRGDRKALTASIAAANAATIRIGPIAPGSYAISLIHDENGNGKLDTMIAIPREGFGFSRDAPVRFGPPRFADALVAIRPGSNRQSIRIRYVL